jgi:hypothetical protein
MTKKTTSEKQEEKPLSAGDLAKKEKAEKKKAEEAALAAPTAEFASGQDLARAIAQQCDLVAVGSKLLRDGEAKGASVRARMFETTVEYLYGKPAPAAAPESGQVVFVCDIPRPAREKKLPE